MQTNLSWANVCVCYQYGFTQVADILSTDTQVENKDGINAKQLSLFKYPPLDQVIVSNIFNISAGGEGNQGLRQKILVWDFI